MHALRTSPRLTAALGALVYVLGLVIFPTLHVASHHADHTHSVGAVPKVDWARVRDAKTGRVNLDRLAEEIGFNDSAHAKAHADGRAHEHSGEHRSSNDLDHGLGSAEHFSLSLLTAAPLLVVTHAVVVLDVPPVAIEVQAPLLRLTFLDAQRSQAPPV